MKRTSVVLSLFFATYAHAMPIVDGMQAQFQWGQSDFVSGYVDFAVDVLFGARETSNESLFSVSDVVYDDVGERLIVADLLNHRVLIVPAKNNELPAGQASMVLGQPDFSTGGANLDNPFGNADTPNATFGCIGDTNACGMRRAWAVDYDPARDLLFVADPDNSRIMVWRLGAAGNGTPANFILGQQGPSTNTRDIGCDGETTGTNACGLNTPFDMTFDSVHQLLWVADAANHRVVGYDLNAIETGAPAIYVLGQADQTGNELNMVCADGRIGCGLNSPEAVSFDSVQNRLFVFDAGNSRVVSFDFSGGIQNGMSATGVLGQPDLFTSTPNTSCGGGQSGEMNTNNCGLGFWGGQVSVDIARQRLYVSDSSNQRVSVFDISTMVDGQPAIGFVGASQGYNPELANFGGGTSRNQFVIPMGISFDNASDRLFVADSGNHRVMTFGPTVGQIPILPVGDIVETNSYLDGNGDTVVELTNSFGHLFEVVLPMGTTAGPTGDIILAIDYYDANRETAAIAISATLPPERTKTVSIPAGPKWIGIIDQEVDAAAEFPDCPHEFRHLAPEVNDCKAILVDGELGDNPNDPNDPRGRHTITVCNDGTQYTITGLLHSAVGYSASGDFTDKGDPRRGDVDADITGCSSTSPGPISFLGLLMMGLMARRRIRA